MSGLAALLAGRAAPGTYRWRSGAAVADVRDTVEHAGWRFAHHDGRADETRADVLAGLGTALDFPAYYGQNLDALADCLRDVVPATSTGTLLLWDAWGPFARAHERSFTRVLQVLRGRSGEERGAPFAVLLRGDGPGHDDAPELG
jgi:RNAse (barnase) inhibitor barstar